MQEGDDKLSGARERSALAEAISAMREASIARLDAHIAALLATREHLARSTDDAVRRLERSSSPPASPGATTPQPGSSTSFQASGTVTANDGQPIPGLKLRIVDTQGMAVAESPDWRTDQFGRYSVKVMSRQLKAATGVMRLELADAAGNALSQLNAPVSPGGNVAADLTLTPTDGTVLAAQANSGRLLANALANSQKQADEQVAAIRARQQLASSELEAELAAAKDSRAALG